MTMSSCPQTTNRKEEKQNKQARVMCLQKEAALVCIGFCLGEYRGGGWDGSQGWLGEEASVPNWGEVPKRL